MSLAPMCNHIDSVRVFRLQSILQKRWFLWFLWLWFPWSLFSFSVFGNLLPIGFIALKRFSKVNFICDFWKFTSHRKSSPLKDFQKTILSATYLKNQKIKSAENFSNERRNGFLVHLHHTLLPVVTGRRKNDAFF